MIRKPQWITLAMLALLIGLGLAGHYASPLLLPKSDVTASPAPGCRLEQSECAATLANDQRIELSITPRPIPVVAPLHIRLRGTGFVAAKVEVDFTGESMNMGFNRVELTRSADGTYAGEAMLPVCVTGGMTWVATVLVETDRQRIAVPFRFDTGK